MVGKLNDIVTAAVVVEAADKVKSSSDMQPKIKASTAHSHAHSAHVKHVEIKPSAKGEKTDLTPQDIQAQAADNLKRKQEEKEQEREAKLVPGSLTEEAVSNMTDALNKLMNKTDVNLHFSYHKEVDMLSVKMLEKGTDKVIKEFPPEEMVENMIKARDWLGAFIDRTI